MRLLVGEDELLLRCNYTWPPDDAWDENSTVVLHLAGCRHGAAHDLVVCGARHSVAGRNLDEVERAILALRVRELSDHEIASVIGSTGDSVATLLRRLTRRLKLVGNDHARLTLAVLHEQALPSESIDDRLDAMLDELLP